MHGITRVGDGGLSFILASRQWLSTHALGTQLSLDWVLSGGGKAGGRGWDWRHVFRGWGWAFDSCPVLSPGLEGS